MPSPLTAPLITTRGGLTSPKWIPPSAMIFLEERKEREGDATCCILDAGPSDPWWRETEPLRRKAFLAE